MDLNRFIDAAVNAVVKSGAEVIILTPPGSSRVEVAKRTGLRVISYKEGGEGWVVARERFVEGAVKEIAGGGRWLVIPPDTATANLLYATLRDKKIIEVLYLPEVYEKIAEGELSEVTIKAVSVRHWVGSRWRSGISLRLLFRAVERPKEVEEAVKAIGALAPSTLGLGEILGDVANDVARSALASLIASFLLPQPLSLLPLLSDVFKHGVESLLSKIREFRRGPSTRLADFLKAARRAAPHLDDEAYEGVVDAAASAWGFEAVAFKKLVKKLAGLTEQELSERLNRLEDSLEGLKGQLAELELRFYKVMRLPHFEYPGVVLRGDRLAVHVLEEARGYRHVFAEVVAAGAFGKAAGELAARLRRGGFVAMVGPRGIGKSTLAAWLLWEMLRRGEVGAVVRVEKLDLERSERLLAALEACIGKYRPLCGPLVVVYDPAPPSAYGAPAEARPSPFSEMEETLKYLVVIAERVPVLAVLPSDALNALSGEVRRLVEEAAYPPDLRDREFVEALVAEYSKSEGGEPCPSGIVAKIAEGILQLDEGYALIARLAGNELRRAGCKAEEVEELLRAAGGSALAFIVHYANKLLGVKVREDGEERIRPDRVRGLSRLLAVRQPLVVIAKPGEYVMPSGLVESWFGWEVLSYSEGEARWLAARHHQPVEEALARIVDAATGEIGEVPGSLEKALDPWIHHSDKELRGGVKLKEASEAVKYFAEKYGERLLRKLSQCAEPKCWRRIALMAGAALTAFSFRTLAEAVEMMAGKGKDMLRGLVEAAGQSGLDRLFLEGGKLTPFSRALLIASAQPGYVADVRGIADEAKALWQKWGKRGRFFDFEAVYAIGLAVLLAKAKELGAGVSEKDAEYALRAASFGVQMIPWPYAVWGVIKVLSPLGESAPNQWAVILHAASLVVATSKSEIRKLMIEELDKLYKLDQEEKPLKNWAKAYLAHAYASLREAEKACSLLGNIEDKALRTVAEAFVYSTLVTFGRKCRGMDVYRRLEEVAKELGEMTGKLDELKADEELMEYVKRHSPKPEEGLALFLKDSLGFALSGSAKCALDEGDFEEAEELFGQAAEVFKSLGIGRTT